MNSKEEDKKTGLEQTNSLLQLWVKIKDSIFNVLFVLLDKNDEEEESLIGLLFQVGFDYLQMMSFPFDAAVIAVWKGGSTLDSITVLLTSLSIDSFLPSVSIDTFLIMVYTLILMIILVILDIIYVSYSFSKKKFRFTWPLIFLARVVPLFVTVFFLPIMETLYSVVTCEVSANDPAVQVMSSFPDIVCWEGLHLFHTVVTLLFSTIFVFISSIVALAMFEPRMSTNRLTARQDSTGEVVFIINKIVCQFVFSFTPFEGTWIYCTMLFALSAWLYWSYNVNDPYYNKKASKFFRIFSAYYFWTNFMLMLSQILSIFGFEGGLIVWLSGIFFIGLIIIFEKKSNIDKLFASNLKFRSGEQLESHIKYVLQLLHNQSEDKNSYMLLLGYIEKHKDICTEDDCPLKTKRRLTDNSNQMEENCRLLDKQLERMYKSGIKKYPTCTKLRLSFAFFYLEKLKNNTKAYEQFTIAQGTDPSFGEEFIIYRFRKIIREKLDEKNKDDDADLVQIIKLDNHVSLCEEAMLLSAQLHRDFWTELSEEGPDLIKLNSIGSKITQTISNVASNFEQIKKITKELIEIKYNYALYQIFVQQQDQNGRKLLAQAKQAYRQKLRSQADSELDQHSINDINIDQQGEAILIVSAKEEQQGRITVANTLFTQLTGFVKEQIVNRNLEKFLPDIYTHCHAQTMETWLKAVQPSEHYVNETQEGFIKHKSGFVIPVSYRVKFYSDNRQFIVSFKSVKSQKEECIILTDAWGIIRDVSLLCYPMLGLDREVLQQSEIPVDSFIKTPEGEQQSKHCLNFDALIAIRGRDRIVEVNKQQVKFHSSSIVTTTMGRPSKIVASGKKRIMKVGYIYTFSFKETRTLQQRRRTTGKHAEAVLLEAIFEESNARFYGEDSERVGDFSCMETIEKCVFTNYAKSLNIVTRRLLPNGDFQRVWQDEDDQSDYDFEQTKQEESQLLRVRRLSMKEYQSKIRSSMNTPIVIKHLVRLGMVILLFLVLISSITIAQFVLARGQLERQKSCLADLTNTIEEFQFMAAGVTSTFFPELFLPETYTRFQNHTFQPLPSIQVNYLSEDGLSVNKSITDVMMSINGRLMQYYNPHIADKSFLSAYANYIRVYQQVQLHSQPFSYDNSQNYWLLLLSFILSIASIAFWSYVILLIDKKKTSIMLWFLQIPMDYVTFLNSNCTKFLKGYSSVKELQKRGIELEGKDQYFELYKDQTCEEEEDFQQQRKARKRFIFRYNKRTLLSKLDTSYLKLLWLVIYALAIPITIILLSQKTFFLSLNLEPQINLTGRQIMWGYSLQIGTQLSEHQRIPPGINLEQFITTAKSKFLNIITSNQMVEFNRNVLDFESSQIVELYSRTYFDDICRYTEADQSRCKSIFDGRLRGGYNAFAKFTPSIDESNVDQLYEAQVHYLNPALLKLISTQKAYINTNIESTIRLSQVLVYAFIILNVLGFCVPWILYLSGENTKLNQTIRMLNMIPLFLLPRARKETRHFIDWLVSEANKNNHNQE